MDTRLDALFAALDGFSQMDLPNGMTLGDAGNLFNALMRVHRSTRNFQSVLGHVEHMAQLHADNRHENELMRLKIR